MHPLLKSSNTLIDFFILKLPFKILRPIPASPMHKPTPNVSPPSQLAASQASHLYVDSSSALAKSRSLPRGLPSDGSAFNAVDTSSAASTASTLTSTSFRPPPASGPQSLNPALNDQLRRQPVRPPGTTTWAILVSFLSISTN